MMRKQGVSFGVTRTVIAMKTELETGPSTWRREG